MKKLILFCVGAVLLGLASCGDSAKLKDANERNQQLEGDVSELIATQDSLLVLVNDITDGMNQIKQLEGIISAPGGLDGESASRKEEIKNDIMAIQQALQERRQKLEEMEARLNAMSGENATLKKTVASLRSQIDTQQREIASLTEQLAAANVRIEQLGNTVARQNEQITSLNSTVEQETREREIAQAEAARANAEANTVYYCIGSNKELKANGILEKANAFSKTKTLQGDYNLSYFTRADKRSLSTINTHAPKASLKTSHPKGSYTLEKVGDEMVLTITNRTKFWGNSHFLVIETK